MLVLVAIATVPLLAFAWMNILLQRAGPSDHALLGHYGYMAALSFTVIGAGLLAAARPDGWRLAGWIAGILPIALALVSLAYPDVDGSIGPFWGGAATAWSVLYIGVVERARRNESRVTSR
jgi:peptidoglycan/LPS O-acetylase OafA/YrhL